MNLLQGAAAITLWRSGQFDTLHIAEVLGVTEPDVVRFLDAVRDRERGPDLRLVEV